MSIIDPNFSDEDEATPALFASAVKSGTLSAIWCDTQRGRGLRSHPPQTHNESLSESPQNTVIYFKALKKKRTGQTIVPRWDLASKNKQRLLIQQQQPWQKSTGPRSEYGRLVSSRNAKKRRNVGLVSFPETLENAGENLLKCQVCVTQFSQGDTDRALGIGDCVRYIGDCPQTVLACGYEPMLVAGFCQLGTGAIACRTAFEKIVWIYPKDLERCPDGHQKAD